MSVQTPTDAEQIRSRIDLEVERSADAILGFVTNILLDPAAREFVLSNFAREKYGLGDVDGFIGSGDHTTTPRIVFERALREVIGDPNNPMFEIERAVVHPDSFALLAKYASYRVDIAPYEPKFVLSPRLVLHFEELARYTVIVEEHEPIDWDSDDTESSS